MPLDVEKDEGFFFLADLVLNAIQIRIRIVLVILLILAAITDHVIMFVMGLNIRNLIATAFKNYLCYFYIISATYQSII